MQTFSKPTQPPTTDRSSAKRTDSVAGAQTKPKLSWGTVTYNQPSSPPYTILELAKRDSQPYISNNDHDPINYPEHLSTNFGDIDEEASCPYNPDGMTIPMTRLEESTRSNGEDNQRDESSDTQRLLSAANRNFSSFQLKRLEDLEPASPEQLIASMYLNACQVCRLWALSLVQLFSVAAIDFYTSTHAHTLSYLLYLFFTLMLIVISVARLAIYRYKTNKRFRQLDERPTRGYYRAVRLLIVTVAGLLILTIGAVVLLAITTLPKIFFNQLSTVPVWPTNDKDFPPFVNVIGRWYYILTPQLGIPVFIVIIGLHSLLAFRDHSQPLPSELVWLVGAILLLVLGFQVAGTSLWGYLAWKYFHTSELTTLPGWSHSLEPLVMNNLLVTLAVACYLSYFRAICSSRFSWKAFQQPIAWCPTIGFFIGVIFTALISLAAAYFLYPSQTMVEIVGLVFGRVIQPTPAANSTLPVTSIPAQHSYHWSATYTPTSS